MSAVKHAAKDSIDSLRAAMVGAGIVVDQSVRPGWRWVKAHRCEMIAFSLIAVLIVVLSATYHAPHESGVVMVASPEQIEKAVKDHAPCPGTTHATNLDHRCVCLCVCILSCLVVLLSLSPCVIIHVLFCAQVQR